MKFEWDKSKSQLNLRKHGIDFETATQLWEDTHVELSEIAKSVDGETRSATIGQIGSLCWVAIWTKRKGKIRIISVRRTRNEERKTFFEIIQKR